MSVFRLLTYKLSSWKTSGEDNLWQTGSCTDRVILDIRCKKSEGKARRCSRYWKIGQEQLLSLHPIAKCVWLKYALSSALRSLLLSTFRTILFLCNVLYVFQFCSVCSCVTAPSLCYWLYTENYVFTPGLYFPPSFDMTLLVDGGKKP